MDDGEEFDLPTDLIISLYVNECASIGMSMFMFKNFPLFVFVSCVNVVVLWVLVWMVVVFNLIRGSSDKLSEANIFTIRIRV